MKVLEDNPLFNAGTGSVLTFEGEVEMDAAVAHGSALGFRAIAGIRNIQHPISLARTVMERTDHVLLQDTGAQELARRWASRLTIPLSRKGTPSGASTASASLTGLGESMMRTLITKTACDSRCLGLDAQGAAPKAVNMLSNMLATEAGIIVIDNQGGISFAQNTPHMAHAWFKQGMPKPVAGL